MSRVRDAMQRARVDVVNFGPQSDTSGDSIHFFAPGQPSVVIPWDVENSPGEPAQHSEPRHSPPPPQGSAAPPAPTLLAQPDRQVVEPAHWPPQGSAEKLVVSSTTAPAVREQYGKLAASLRQAQLEHKVKVVVLAGTCSREGTTLTAANLALTFSESHRRRVLLVDANLRRPMVHHVLGMANERGLSNALAFGEKAPLVPLNPRLSVLTAGTGGGDPMKTLVSDRMSSLIQEARAEFEWILIDTPAVGLWPDATVVASMADVVLLVAVARKTPYDGIRQAAEAMSPARIFGVVLNDSLQAASA